MQNDSDEWKISNILFNSLKLYLIFVMFTFTV